MAKAKSTGGGSRPIPDAKTYLARCIGVVELGTQKETWKGETKEQFKVHFTWELLGTKAIFNPEKGEQPFVVSEKYTNSISERSNMGKMIKAWRNKPYSPEEMEHGYDTQQLLGKPCMIQVIHNKGIGKNEGKTFANVASVSNVIDELKDKVKQMKPVNPLTGLVIGNANQFDEYEKIMNPKVKEMLNASPEWQEELKKHGKTVDTSSSSDDDENGIHTGSADDEDQF